MCAWPFAAELHPLAWGVLYVSYCINSVHLNGYYMAVDASGQAIYCTREHHNMREHQSKTNTLPKNDLKFTHPQASEQIWKYLS